MLIQNTTIFDGERLLENKDVLLSQTKIVQISNHAPNNKNNKTCLDGSNRILVPGFIDIQVNGGGGAFFNEDPSAKTLKIIRDAHLQYGTTSFLPTFISDEFEQTKKALSAVKESIAQSLNGILGIHLEGPYLNSEKSGVHNKKNIRKISQQEINEIAQFQLPLKLVTLAPELVSDEILKFLLKNNVFVFAGHTNATFAQMQQAFAQGVTGITHFFNACSPFTSRAPGVVGAGLFYDNIWCGLIADGLHVSFDSIKIAFKCKSTKKFILVSDAMSPVGTNLSEFNIHGEKITVRGNKYEDAKGTLAGSSLTMHQAVKNIVENKCATVEQALAMSSTNAAQCLQLDHIKGKVCEGFDADLVLLKKINLELVHVIQAGVLVK